MTLAQDRTAEFRAAARLLRSQAMGMPRPPPAAVQTTSAPDAAKQKEFSRIAKAIAKEMTETFGKLERLNELASKKALFDDNPREVQELTYIIQQDIQSLNRAIKQLKDFAQQQHSGTRRDLLHQHANTVVISLQSRLASTSKRFKSVLETRTANLKAAHSRRDQFAGRASVSSSAEMSTLLGAQSPAAASVSAATSNFQQLAVVDRQESYLQERENAMQAINSTIVDLTGIFQQLATMVHEQGEQIARIDAHVAETELNVEAAHGELTRYLQTVTSNRWLMLKIFGVLILFFILFVVFAA